MNYDPSSIVDRARLRKEAFKSVQKEAYSDSNFLHFGIEGGYPDDLDVDGTMKLLDMFGTDVFAHGLQDMGREGPQAIEALPDNVHLCDFCGRVLSGVQYDRLTDGRERCIPCTRTVIKKAKDVRELFQTVKRQMVLSYGITFDNPIDAVVTNAKKLQARIGTTFIATPGMDGRALGFVVTKRRRQELWLENGCPRASLMSTCAHELTHVWQNQNEYFFSLANCVSREEYLLIVEGMATWSEVQYLKLANEADFAEVKLAEYRRREDVYGVGFRMYEERYGFSEGRSIIRDTPFNHPEGPLV